MEDIAKKCNILQNQILKEIGIFITEINRNLDIIIKGEYSFIEKFNIILDLFDSNEIEVSQKEFYDILRYIMDGFEQIALFYQKAFYKKLSVPTFFNKIKERVEREKAKNRRR
jgi:hypothetical protein